MNRRAELALARLASTQYSVFTRTDAAAHGMGRGHLARRVTAGRYTQLARDVFAIEGSPPTWFRSVFATCRAGGPGCVASHATAASLHGLDGFPTPWLAPMPIEVVVRRPRNRFELGGAMPDVVVHLTRDIGPEDVTERHGIPCTTVARTLFDLLATHDPLEVQDALDSATRDRKVFRSDVEDVLSRLRKKGRIGGSVLQDLLDGRDGEGPGSLLERRFFRLLERANLPPPVSQYEVARPGRRSAFLDYAYVDEKIAIELQGQYGHTTRRQQTRDAIRGNDVQFIGWALLEFTRDMVRSTPAVVASQLARQLRERRRAAS